MLSGNARPPVLALATPAPRPQIRRMPAPRASTLALAAVLAAALPACGHECDGPYARCEGNVAANCGWRWLNELSGRWELRRDDCGARVCQEPPSDTNGSALCALDAEPDPACPPELRALGRASACVDGAVVTWAWGYRIDEAACAPGAVCADTTAEGFDPACAGVALCSPLDAPDPLCEEGVFTACADERTIVYCTCGWRSDAHACADPGPSCTLVPVDGARDQGACR